MSEENDKLALYAVRGNTSAHEFLQLITQILHIWDDLIDKDKKLTDAQISECFWRMLVTLPRNQFYSENFIYLNPILVNAIQSWLTANRLENEYLMQEPPGLEKLDDSGLEIAFIIRSAYCDLVIHSALICGGYEWAQEIGYKVHKMWHGETLAGYKINLYKQQTDGGKLNG